MSFEELLIDSMDVRRPKVPIEPEEDELKEGFAHLRNDFTGEDEGEDPTLEAQRCRVSEKTSNDVMGEKIITSVNTVIYCEPCDVQERDRLFVTTAGGTEKTLTVIHRKEVSDSDGIHHYSLSVREVQ